MAMNPIDRFAEYVDTLFDPLFGLAATKSVPQTGHKWWVVITSTMTHLVITDHQRSIVIAPTVWNKYIGQDLNVVLTQHHGRAVPIPGPHPEREP